MIKQLKQHSGQNGEFIDVPVRVRYADTDMMGVVYHANYPVFFETALVFHLIIPVVLYKFSINPAYRSDRRSGRAEKQGLHKRVAIGSPRS